MAFFFFFAFFSYFIQCWAFYPQLTLPQLIQLNLESWFIVRSLLVPSIYSGSSLCAGLQMVTQSTHLSKGCCPKLVFDPHRSEIRPPKQLDYRCMSQHLENERIKKKQFLFHVIAMVRFHFRYFSKENIICSSVLFPTPRNAFICMHQQNWYVLIFKQIRLYFQCKVIWPKNIKLGL